MKKYLPIFFVTLLSGIASGLSIWRIDNHITFPPNIFAIAPGIIFGTISGVYFWKKYSISILRLFVWIFFSTMAYFISTRPWIIFGGFSSIIGNGNYIPNFLAAGVFGTLILAWIATLLIKKLQPDQIGMLVLIGGVAGFIFGKIYWFNGFDSEDNESILRLISAYTIWQMSVGIALDVLIDKNKK